MSELTELVDRLLRGEEDPYPIYTSIREAGRVCWVPGLERWLVTGHEEALTVLAHSRVSANRRPPAPAQRTGGYQPGGLPFVDPPEHTRLRSLIQPAFGPKAVQRLRPKVESLVGEFLDRVGEHDEFDLIEDFAGPLPAIVLAELLGIPASDQELFRSWATMIIETIDPVSLRVMSDQGDAAHADITGYLTEIIDARRRRPADDVISDMVQAEESGQRLSGAELLQMCVLLVIVGIETTTNLIGNGVNALFAHPAQAQDLRAEPKLIKTALEELLRYDSPVQLAGRVAADDIEVGGQTLRAGQIVGIVLGAANRDPASFAMPERLDLARSPNNHIGFGRGIHFCLGAPLARLEGAIAIPALLSRFPRLSPVGTAKYRQNVHVRGFASLPVAPR